MSAERAPIFDEIERTDGAPSGHAEPIFDFLNRVAGECWVHPRRLMQAWADRISDPLHYTTCGNGSARTTMTSSAARSSSCTYTSASPGPGIE